MSHYYKRAIKDILENRFQNLVTIITIAFSVLIVSAFALFFYNAGNIMNSWREGIRIMVYLSDGITKAQQLNTKYRFAEISGIQTSRFISKQEALDLLKQQLQRQSSLLGNLKENPLPDAFEITLKPSSQNYERLEFIAKRLENLPFVDEVEYGRRWMQGVSAIVNLFSITGYAFGALFLLASVFIVANTIRLVLYSRQEEIRIMKLVGATNRFIKIPFYIEALIQGILGSLLGLTFLYGVYLFIGAYFETGITAKTVEICFLPYGVILFIIISGMGVGLIGGAIALKQFLKS